MGDSVDRFYRNRARHRDGSGQAHRAVEGDITGVTRNLGVAFNSTFIALLISIVLMFLLHQFRLDMITNRESIDLHPELATVIQMDGQGPIGTKYETYAVLTRQPDADRYWWGWKNFYDEDSPTPTPAQVLDLDPLPVYVSYQ